MTSRREALKQVALASLLTAGAVRWLDAWAPVPDDDELVPFTDIPENFTTRRKVGDETLSQGLDLRELRSWMTSNDDYFAVQHYGIPRVDAAAWRLQLRGLAATPITLTLDELKRRPRVERTVAFECSGNGARVIHRMIGNARWAGASLTALLRDARPATDTKEVVFWGADEGKEKIRDGEYTQNFARTMPIDDVMQADAILAYEMNGQPLPAAHGHPVRVIVPGWYGVQNVKWLTQIELSASRLMNRFTGRDYVTIMGRQVGDKVEWVETSVGRQRVKSVVARVTKPKGAPGPLTAFGAAWTDGTPLKAVEVQVDGGAWQAAKLEANPNPFAWTFWSVSIGHLAPGQHTVVSRATDQKGRGQPPSLELKKTYWEDNAQFKRTIQVS